jgi:hypothetical protein
MLAAALAALVAGQAGAAVTAQEAAKLKGELTPFGAERAGNKDGSIPAWDGGYTKPIPGDDPQGRRADPFKDEKPLFSINAKNFEQYADRLSEGSKAMFKRFPDYRIDVYKTHRTAAAPQWVYDNTFKNATRASLKGDLPEGAYGGIPFPIPKTGEEVIWNHSLRWRAPSLLWNARQFQITADGRTVMTADVLSDLSLPYYFEEGSPEEFAKEGDYYLIRLVNKGPAMRAGEALTSRFNIDGDKGQVWVYLTGQRRVRKVPNGCCDQLTPATAGIMTYDEIETWTGRPDRFDWKLAGKKELYIPYNNNKVMGVKDADFLGKFPNPDHVRWELHRVWVIDATLRQGFRHQTPKSRYYCEEDTWTCVLAERWDANGQLWKALWTYTFVAPDLPGTVTGSMGFNDMLSGAAFMGNVYGGVEHQYVLRPRIPDRVFTPDALAGEGVR